MLEAAGIEPGSKRRESSVRAFDEPFLTAFGDSDSVTKHGEKRFIQSVRGAKNQSHEILRGAGHFIQDDAADERSRAAIEFVRANST
jgi:haloalkane dehalogenase